VSVPRLGALLNKLLSGMTTTPHKHDNYTVGTALSSSPPQPLIIEIKLSSASGGTRCLYSSSSYSNSVELCWILEW